MESRRILSAEQAQARAQVLDELTDVIRRGEAILLVGSGCSRPMFPAWDRLVHDLAAVADQCIPEGFPTPDFTPGEEIQALQVIRDAVEAHQSVRRCLDRYKRRLIQLFELNDHQPTRLHELLVRLPFRGILTTNYEVLIERAIDNVRGVRGEDRSLDVQTDEPYYIQRAIRAMAKPGPAEEVIHLHGVHRHPGGLVLTTLDYERAYGTPDMGDGGDAHGVGTGRRTYTTELLRMLMATRRVVFVGFGLRDPALMSVLQAVTDFGWEWDEPIHYGVMPLEEENAEIQWAEAERLRTEYGVEVLFYEVDSGDHSALTGTFEEIAARVGIGMRRVAEEAVEATPPRHPTPGPREPQKAPTDETAAVFAQLEQLTRRRVEQNLGPLDPPRGTDQEATRAD